MTVQDLIHRDYDITHLTTFGIQVRARLFAEYSSLRQLEAIARTPEYLQSETMHIGGGSNLLFLHDFDGMILHSAIKGIRIYRKDEEKVYVIAGAGERWSDLVDRCVEEGLAGLECMAGIPGEVGAAPVQNVGAYGQEAGDTIFNVECFDSYTRQTVTFRSSECGFSYRDSRFKRDWRGRYYVLRVSFLLTPTEYASVSSHGALAGLADRLGHRPTLKDVRSEVLSLRASKLPDPALAGSAGSFFKNPVVSSYFYQEEVLTRCPEVPSYPAGEGRVKIPAGWLIDKAGLKSLSVGGAGLWPENALVLVNNGQATAADITRLARKVQQEVNRCYAIRLEREVNYIDTSIRVTALGSGTSKGVPEIGCECRVCRSSDPRDKRMRASVLVQTQGINILIDASPDLRRQALDAQLNHVDAVLLTHIHYDHVGGVDDLRPFCYNGPVNIYTTASVIADLRRRIDYCFRSTLYPGVPALQLHEISSESPLHIDGVDVEVLDVMHGKMPIIGFRIGRFAYITDASELPEATLERLEDLEVLIINALRERPHFAHFSISQALDLIRRVRPRRAYLTHFCHEAGTHEEILARCPDGVEPLYDGEVITIP